MTPTQKVLSALQARGLKTHREKPGQWMAQCPTHDDRKASLSVAEGQDGRALVDCLAGCSTEAVIEALGLKMADLFSSNGNGGKSKTNGKRKRREVKRYIYRDEKGVELFAVHRFMPKDFRQSRPGPDGKRIWNTKSTRKVPYHLPALLRATQGGETVYAVEGEKDVEALEQLGLTATCNAGGAGKWRQEYSEHFRGAARVVIIADADVPGRKHAEQVAASLSPVVADLRTVEMPTGKDVSDWIKAGGTLPELLDLVEDTPRWIARVPESSAAEKPQILVGPDVGAILDEAEAALEAMPGAPRVFVYAGGLARIMSDARELKFLRRPARAAGIERLDQASIIEPLSRAAEWLTPDRRSKAGHKPGWPPAKVTMALLARGRWRFPQLTGIVEAPTLRPDGSILDQPGYDPSTGLYFMANGTTWPDVPDRPTIDDARGALASLAEVWADFEWRAPSDLSAALACALTLTCRSAVDGGVPIFAASANAPAAGKGLALDAAATIAYGRPLARMAAPESAAEDRKRLLSLALSGQAAALVDNIRAGEPFGTPALDAALTAGFIADRLLGTQQRIEAPWRVCVLVTGNALTFAGDTARRTVPLFLETQSEQPEERSGFQHSPLLEWVARERPRLLTAGLTALRAFCLAGKPAQGLSPFGSFEHWSDLIRSAVVWAGYEDPCLGRERIRAEADPAVEALGTALRLWRDRWGDRPMTAAQVVREVGDAKDGEAFDLKSAIGVLCPQWKGRDLNTRHIGEALRSRAGRIVGGLRFVRAGTYQRAIRWAVRPVSKVSEVTTYARNCQMDINDSLSNEHEPPPPDALDTHNPSRIGGR